MNVIRQFGERRRAADPEIAAGDPSVPRHVVHPDGVRARDEREARLPPAAPVAQFEPGSAAIEAELGEYIRANRASLASINSAAEGDVEFDLETPPERAVEIANLVTSGYETYVLDLRKVRAEVIAEAARHVFQIDGLIEDLSHARDNIAKDTMQFMHLTRNGVAAVIEARKLVAARPRLPASVPVTTEGEGDDRSNNTPPVGG